MYHKPAMITTVYVCTYIVILGPVLGLEVVEQRARAGEDSEATLCYVYMMPLLRRYSFTHGISFYMHAKIDSTG